MTTVEIINNFIVLVANHAEALAERVLELEERLAKVDEYEIGQAPQSIELQAGLIGKQRAENDELKRDVVNQSMEIDRLKAQMESARSIIKDLVRIDAEFTSEATHSLFRNEARAWLEANPKGDK